MVCRSLRIVDGLLVSSSLLFFGWTRFSVPAIRKPWRNYVDHVHPNRDLQCYSPSRASAPLPRSCRCRGPARAGCFCRGLPALGLDLSGHPHRRRDHSSAHAGWTASFYRGAAPLSHTSLENRRSTYQHPLEDGRGDRFPAAVCRKWRGQLGGTNRSLGDNGVAGDHGLSLAGHCGLACGTSVRVFRIRSSAFFKEEPLDLRIPLDFMSVQNSGRILEPRPSAHLLGNLVAEFLNAGQKRREAFVRERRRMHRRRTVVEL